MTSLTGVRALVLGGSVFVGKHLVDGLVGRGASVSVLNRGRTPAALPPGVEHVVADRTDDEQLRAALAGREWDIVFDVSGFVMAAGGSDIDGLLALLDGRAGSYVYTSSIMAYDQSWVGVFPWTEDQPTNPGGPATYGGFKAIAEAAMLARHAATGFPASIVRPAAIYGPDNNIFDMETPMFLRLLQHRPILVPHGGLVVGSYGHVDDLCDAMITVARHPAAPGEVFNVTGESLDVNRYVAVLADVVDREPDVVYAPDALLPELDESGAAPVFGHLFKTRHHAMVSTEKARRLLGYAPRYDVRSGHEQTFEWFQRQGWADLDRPLVDLVWKASWDFAAEAALAERIRDG
ncbi:MAG TPA: NAD-dependent epimerase/dehydratase family protein [Acidimicrobiales bacterium]|nr:NAD-dependent epimerase/dehydratase family protein [Acidimicrobiales bacterium]